MPTTVAPKTDRLSFNKLRTGNLLSTTYYLRINRVTADGVEVTDQWGNSFTVKGKSLIENTMNSANQFSTTQKVTKTEMAEKLENAGDSVFTVEFEKQDGTTRVLTGHLLGAEPKMGRTQVIDLEVITGNPSRLVDNRTISSLILKGTKYVTK